MKIKVDNRTIEFQTLKVQILNKNQENIFEGNTRRSLDYRLEKALINKKDGLHYRAKELKEKYYSELNMSLGSFLIKLKNESNLDYKLFLNKYGDGKFCEYSITNFQNDKGIYCYILENQITYIGRSKKTFNERFNDYGKITPYNCLIDGQSTNCNINSKVNELETLTVGFYLMNESSDKEIEQFEKKLIHSLKKTNKLWNVQQN
jgi:hypothetical protein